MSLTQITSFITLPAHRKHTKSAQDTTFEIPLWVRSLSKCRNLRRLAPYWEYPDTEIVRRTVNSAKLMPCTMLENGHKLKGGKRIITKFRHIGEDQIHKKIPRPEVDPFDGSRQVSASKGRHMRLVKVLPDRWYRTCGASRCRRLGTLSASCQLAAEPSSQLSGRMKQTPIVPRTRLSGMIAHGK